MSPEFKSPSSCQLVSSCWENGLIDHRLWKPRKSDLVHCELKGRQVKPAGLSDALQCEVNPLEQADQSQWDRRYACHLLQSPTAVRSKQVFIYTYICIHTYIYVCVYGEICIGHSQNILNGEVKPNLIVP